ncbi:MAG: YraN family protein [Clostridia bacterium]|nr:YraN family protein [Clostridia bacterium]
MNEKRKIGDIGEDAACKFLENKGYKIIKRNFYCRVGEIDIIATNGTETIFIEVKTRKSDSYGRASEFVTYQKQQKIKKTALYYIGGTDTFIRFDVVEIYHKNGEITEINHIENAFC